MTRLEDPPAFPEDPHRVPQNVKHSGADHPVKGLLPESQVGRIPNFKMHPAGAPGPESIGPGHPYQNTTQIDPNDSDLKRPLHHFNGEVARARAKIKEKALVESRKDFLGDLSVVTLDDKPRGLLIKRGQRAGDPLYGESPFQTRLYVNSR